MEKKGTHEKGSRSAGAQCSSGDLFRGANTRGRAEAQRTRTEAKKIAQELRKTTKKVSRQGRTR